MKTLFLLFIYVIFRFKKVQDCSFSEQFSKTDDTFTNTNQYGIVDTAVTLNGLFNTLELTNIFS